MQLELTYGEIEALIGIVNFAFYEDAYEEAISNSIGEPGTKAIMEASRAIKQKLEDINGCGSCLGCKI